MSQPTQSQIDRANAWATETYPADTAEQRQIMAALELDVIMAADAAKAERETFEASPDAAALDRFRTAYCAGEAWWL